MANEAEVLNVLNQIKAAHEEFKTANDARIKEIEKRGSADGVLVDKIERMNDKITELQGKADALQAELKERNVEDNRVAILGPDGRVAQEVKLTKEEKEYHEASLKFLRKGVREEILETRGMEAGDDQNGGYLLAKPATGRIVAKVYETTPFRQYATIETITSDQLTGLVDNDEAASGWVGETEARTSATATPTVGNYDIPVYEIWAQPEVTQRFLDDAATDVERWLSDKVSGKFSRQENSAFIIGNGTKKPMGILAMGTASTADASRAWGTVQYIASGASGAFASTSPADPLIEMAYSLKAAYRGNARWMLARATEAQARKFKDTTGQYLWQPSLQAGRPATLLGYEIIPAEDMPVIAANSLSIAFGDWAAAYTIVDRIGIRVIRDAVTRKGWIRFYTTKRVGGRPVDTEAYKVMKFATS